MSSATLGVRRSASPGVVLRQDSDRGYHSATGEFNYYPTSAHKRRQSVTTRETANNDCPPLRAESDDGLRGVTYSTRAASLSSAGLSRSPSQPEPIKHTVIAKRSASQPLSVSSTCVAESGGVSPAKTEPVKGGAPLLQRYRTAHAPVRHRASSPRHQSSTSELNYAAKPAVKNFRRSLLELSGPKVLKCRSSNMSAMASAPSVSFQPSVPLNALDGAAARVALTTTAVERSVSSSHESEGKVASAGRDAADAAAVVPVARVRLMELGGDEKTPGKNAVRVGCESGRFKSNAMKTQIESHPANYATLDIPESHAAGDGTEKRSDDVTATASRSSSVHPRQSTEGRALLSVDASQQPLCHDRRCVHSAESIGEFILMQRELRRCYAALEDYEEVVGQLRRECAEAWTAYHQLQQQSVEREAEAVDAVEAVRAECAEQVRALQDYQERSENERTPAKQSNDAGRSERVGDTILSPAAERCLESTWQETAEELRRALREEKAAHKATRRGMEDAMAKQKSFASRVAELEDLLRDARHSSVPATAVAPESIVSPRVKVVDSATPTSTASASLFRTPSHDHNENRSCAVQASSNGSSPAPRFDSPPHPHQGPNAQCAFTAHMNENGVADSSAISVLTATPEQQDIGPEEGSTTAASPTSVVSSESHSTEQSKDNSLQPSVVGVVEARGSGLVVVEPRRFSVHDGVASQSVSPRNVSEARGQNASPYRSDQKLSEKKLPDQSPPAALSVVREDTTSGTAMASTPGKPKASHSTKAFAQLLERITQGAERHKRSRQEQQELRFPAPLLTQDNSAAAAAHKNAYGSGATKTADPTDSTAVELVERERNELLRALMDKERQLAVVAAERTRYKRLYEQQFEDAWLSPSQLKDEQH